MAMDIQIILLDALYINKKKVPTVENYPCNRFKLIEYILRKNFLFRLPCFHFLSEGLELLNAFLEDIVELGICLNSVHVCSDNTQWWKIHVLI